MSKPAEPIPMNAAPAATLRLGEFVIRTGEPFVIASREDDPDGGTFSYPQLWRTRDTLFLNWHFDWDVSDPRMPEGPNGRLSRDGGRTWRRQTVLAPPGYKAMTGPREVTSYFHAFEIPGAPGRYRIATWRSTDNGESWGPLTWTEVAYPGTRGFDIYDPPEGFRLHSNNYKVGQMRSQPPAYLEELYRQAGSRKRGPYILSIYEDGDGTLYSLAPAYWLRGGEGIAEAEEFWRRLDWTRLAILMQTSTDRGRTWKYGGVVAFDEAHKIVEFDEESCFAEPSMAIYPDGERVCVLRTGGCRPLYLVRSADGGRSWTEPVALPVRSVDPHLALMPGGLLALGTGRPHCSIHFSIDRGRTWPLNERLFTTGERRTPDRYTGSTSNVELTIIDDHTLLYIHDAFRYDPEAENAWLRKGGFGRMVGRFITIERGAPVVSVATEPAAQSLSGVDLVATAREADASGLALDGRLDKAFWAGAQAYPLRELETGKAPRFAGEFRLAWAGDSLYFGIRCEDPETETLNIGATQSDDPRIWNGDCIELLIQTQVHTYYQIVINPAGAVAHANRKDGRDMRWRSGTQVAAHVGDGFWSLEVRLPVVAESPDPLRGVVGRKPTAKEPWRFNVCRQRVRANENDFSAFSPTGFPWFHELGAFATLIVAE